MVHTLCRAPDTPEPSSIPQSSRGVRVPLIRNADRHARRGYVNAGQDVTGIASTQRVDARLPERIDSLLFRSIRRGRYPQAA